MNDRTDHPSVGHWRIVKAGLGDKDHLDLRGPAVIINANGMGDISLGP